MNRYDEKIVELGLQIPESILPVGNFVPYVVANNLVYVSGQIPLQGGRPAFVGKLGRDFTVEEGQKAARICALQVLGIIKGRVRRRSKQGRALCSTGRLYQQPAGIYKSTAGHERSVRPHGLCIW